MTAADESGQLGIIAHSREEENEKSDWEACL